MNAALIAFNQLQSMKEKLDPEVLDLLNKSAHEAIASAHTFLDACEKTLDSLTVSEKDLQGTQEDGDIFHLNVKEN